MHLQRHLILLTLFILALLALSCRKSDAPKPEDRAFSEDFDSLALAIGKGWIAINNSKPAGTSTWHQGVDQPLATGGTMGFPAYRWHTRKTEYASCDYTCAGGLATISCWLVSPVLKLSNGDTLSFWTRTVDPVLYPDRLQVRLNLSSETADVGSDPESVGAFGQLLFDINKDLNKTDYPMTWKKYQWVVDGLHPGEVRNGRIAFRYYVTQGGPSPDSKNSDTIGIDEFSLSPAH